MSESGSNKPGPPAPGWWLASDGNWYPPEQAPAPPLPPPPPPTPTDPAAPQEPTVPPEAAAPARTVPVDATNGIAIAAMVLGIVGVVFGVIPFLFFMALILGIGAVVFGLVGRRRAKRGQGRQGMADAGWILGVVAFALGVFWVAVIDDASSNNNSAIDKALDFTPHSGDVVLTPRSCSSELGGLHATGVALNKSDNVKTIHVEVTFRDADGTLLDTDRVLVGTLFAGDSETYEASGSYDGSATDVTCTAKVVL